MIVNRNETVLLSLTEYSSINNLEWASANALIPVDVATDVTVCIRTLIVDTITIRLTTKTDRYSKDIFEFSWYFTATVAVIMKTQLASMTQ